MKYNVQKIKKDFSQGKRLKYVFFWGHKSSNDGSVTKSCFSQWWEATFEVNQIQYTSAEHWMMAEKARLFDDEEALGKIIRAASPAEAKKLGRQVRNFEESLWNEKRYEIVKQGNMHKFGQHADLKEFLLATHERVLVEASPYDSIWGIGLAQDAPNIENPETWQGLNLLGFALMEVREELR